MNIYNIETKFLNFKFHGVQLLNQINLNNKRFILISLSYYKPQILYTMDLSNLNTKELSYLKFVDNIDANIIITDMNPNTISELFKDYSYDNIKKEVVNVDKANNIMEMCLNIINTQPFRFRKNNDVLTPLEIIEPYKMHKNTEVFLCDEGRVKTNRILPERLDKETITLKGYLLTKGE